MTDSLQRGVMLLQSGLEATETAQEIGSTGGWMLALIGAVVFILPFVLGTLLARALRVKDMARRMSLVLLALAVALTPFVFQEARGNSWRDAIRLGIDLAGGTNMVFQVDTEAAAEAGKSVDSALMDNMVGSIGRRINPSGTEEVTVRRVGADRIEVIIPGADQERVEAMKERITRLGSLEFAILANYRDHADIIREAEKIPPDKTEYRVGTRVIASWRDVGRGRDGQPQDISTEGEVAFRPVPRRMADGTQETVQQFLIVLPPPERRVTGRYLVRASQDLDQNAQPMVSFLFNAQGGHYFGLLTGENLPRKDGTARRLAILLDGDVFSAPSIQARITTNGQITGRFTQADTRALTDVLNAGALDVPMFPEPISEFTISPSLGIDVQEKGLTAIAIAALAVVLFMIAYYLFAGLIADLCLLLNLALVAGAMALIEATFTLPGLAGLVLTIGMAVDTNVLIFERMREEVNRGSSLRMAIQNGFAKALSTIVDANVTTLITAVVLYMIGSDQVRGFAVTLFIGIVMSMFSALFFGRMLFDLAERKRWLKELRMLSVVGATRINFLNKTTICVIVSSVLIIGGMASFFTRGTDNYDIDFTGGTMVSFEFEQPQAVDDVRSRLQQTFQSSISLEQLRLAEEERTGLSGNRYRLRTTETDTEKVAAQINETFADSAHTLRRISVEVSEPQTIAATEPADDDAAAADDDLESFVGGQRAELSFSDGVTLDTVRDRLTNHLARIQQGDAPKYGTAGEIRGLFQAVGREPEEGSNNQFRTVEIRTIPALEAADLSTALASLERQFNTQPLFAEVNSFASAVAEETKWDAVLAMVMSMLAIVVYLWFRFQRVTFGVAAIAAVVHDVLVVVGMVALASYLSGTPVGSILMLEDFKINLPMIAAFMTIVGYSLNDTIVVFDRIREIRGKNPALTRDMINLSLNQTLSRTILTSLTTLIVVLILYVIGGEGIHGFAFALLIGIIIGTYSTIYVATPVLLWLMNRTSARATV